MDTTGAMVEMCIATRRPELAIRFAELGLRAARLLGLYDDAA